jgi:hypothetical protein
MKDRNYSSRFFCKITTSQIPYMSRYVGYVIPTGRVSLAEY